MVEVRHCKGCGCWRQTRSDRGLYRPNATTQPNAGRRMMDAARRGLEDVHLALALGARVKVKEMRTRLCLYLSSTMRYLRIRRCLGICQPTGFGVWGRPSGRFPTRPRLGVPGLDPLSQWAFAYLRQQSLAGMCEYDAWVHGTWPSTGSSGVGGVVPCAPWPAPLARPAGVLWLYEGCCMGGS